MSQPRHRGSRFTGLSTSPFPSPFPSPSPSPILLVTPHGGTTMPVHDTRLTAGKGLLHRVVSMLVKMSA